MDAAIHKFHFDNNPSRTGAVLVDGIASIKENEMIDPNSAELIVETINVNGEMISHSLWFVCFWLALIFFLK